MTLTVSGLLLLSSSESRKQSLMMPFLELQSTWNRVRKAPDLAGGYSYSDAPELEHAAVRTCGVQEPEEQEKYLVLFATESKHLLPRRGDSRRDTTPTPRSHLLQVSVQEVIVLLQKSWRETQEKV